MKKIALLVGVPILVGIAAWPALAQSQGRYYPETGHTLDARFVEYFDVHGSLEILGFPITDSFIDPLSGRFIQYLQNTRMELVPDQSTGGMTVHLSSLGEMLGGWEIPSAAGTSWMDPGACRDYAESGHRVCYAFLDFYDAHGGPALFGYPISEFRLENDRIVQYFQGFRLDWYPEDLSGSAVRVAPLGRAQFEVAGYDPRLLRPSLPTDIFLYRVTELRAKPSILHPVVASNGEQIAFVQVRDQNLNPIHGAAVTLTAHLGAEERTFLLPLTDERGFTQASLTFESQPPGTRIVLDFWVVYGEFQTTTEDSFLVWW
jgi:hypothetical protein